jgi:sphingomyelin phosphodiesterase acid-like 3
MKMIRVLFLSIFLGLCITNYIYADSKQFIAVGDIHFNPFLYLTDAEGKKLAKDLISNDSTDWDQFFTNDVHKESTTQLGDDTNCLLFNSLITYFKTLSASEGNNFKFVLLTGDILGHGFRHTFNKYSTDTSDTAYKSLVKKVYSYIVWKIQSAFNSNPPIPVYPIIGNRDSLERDYVFSFVKDGDGNYVNETFELISEINTYDGWNDVFADSPTGTDNLATFNGGGCYEFTPTEGSKHSIIVLNTVLLSPYSTGANTDTVVDNQFTWLTDKLQAAQNDEASVYIVCHIPYGFSAAKQALGKSPELLAFDYNNRLLDIFGQYCSVIKAIISGHLHCDGFRFDSTDARIPFCVIVPAISSNPTQCNPAFKIFTYDASSFELQNSETHYCDISVISPSWSKEYDFNTAYPGTPPLLKNGIEAFIKEGGVMMGPLTVSYIRYCYSQGGILSKLLSVWWNKYYWPSITTPRVKEI